MYVVDESECTGCGICMDYCNVGAIAMRGQVVGIEQERCNSCGACREVCPQNAIHEIVHTPLSRSLAVAASVPAARNAPVTVSLRANRLTREEKAAALATVLPAVSKVIVRLAERFLLRSDRGLRTGSVAKGDHGISHMRSGRGRHRWRGGS